MTKIKIVNNDGVEEEIESFTQEEVDAKIREKEEEFGSKIKEKDDIVINLQREKEELQSKLGGVKEDHPNFKVLKDALAKKDEEISTIKNDINKDREERKVSGMITKFSKGNEELEKKIKFHLENTVSGMKSDTEDDLNKKIDAALKLSMDYSNPGVFDGGINSNSGNSFGKSGLENSVEFTAREKALGQKLGLTEEDYKKYGPRLKNK